MLYLLILYVITLASWVIQIKKNLYSLPFKIADVFGEAVYIQSYRFLLTANSNRKINSRHYNLSVETWLLIRDISWTRSRGHRDTLFLGIERLTPITETEFTKIWSKKIWHQQVRKTLVESTWIKLYFLFTTWLMSSNLI